MDPPHGSRKLFKVGLGAIQKFDLYTSNSAYLFDYKTYYINILPAKTLKVSNVFTTKISSEFFKTDLVIWVQKTKSIYCIGASVNILTVVPRINTTVEEDGQALVSPHPPFLRGTLMAHSQRFCSQTLPRFLHCFSNISSKNYDKVRVPAAVKYFLFQTNLY